jgi:hypothetical protein
MKMIDEDKAKLYTDPGKLGKDVVRRVESRIQTITLEENRAYVELEKNVETGKKYVIGFNKEKDENKALALVNSDVHNSTIFELDNL